MTAGALTTKGKKHRKAARVLGTALVIDRIILFLR
jgi:hypothetical protein